MEFFYARCNVLNVEEHKQGHFILSLQHNTPFKTEFIKFFLKDKARIQIEEGLEEKDVKEGDGVIIEYHYENSFPKLDGIWFGYMGYHDECDRCHAYLPAQLAQRMEPWEGCCKYIRYEDQRDHLDREMKLVEKSVGQYSEYLGMYLKFSDEASGEYYDTVIYDDSPLFKTELELLNKYRIIAWKGENNSIDLVEFGELLMLCTTIPEGNPERFQFFKS